MLKKFTNDEIYRIATSQAFADFTSYIPAKANFIIQKNFSVFAAAAQGIEEARLEVAKHYGELTEDGTKYNISEENMKAVSDELAELFSMEQELDIKTFDIDSLGTAEFTPAQMQILMYMIED